MLSPFFVVISLKHREPYDITRRRARHFFKKVNLFFRVVVNRLLAMTYNVRFLCFSAGSAFFLAQNPLIKFVHSGFTVGTRPPRQYI